ncbi:MAG: 50S ribosomal protein L17 [Deltaproteobacteria bacterium RBG_16_54_11]|jgi:large subunit ribosomal protein L17|nr:MAG: 50S ribosomal protein L17 [Deltaproteobacteria bacterium RBG_16_54_11]
MRHRQAGRKLNRTTSHRLMMLRNMVTSLFEHERIETTEAKAKEVRSLAERLITLGKKGDLHARRQALRIINSKKVAHKLFTEITPRFAGRNGGYTHILKTRNRPGDAAALAIIELLPPEVKEEKEKAGKKPAKKKTAEKKS